MSALPDQEKVAASVSAPPVNSGARRLRSLDIFRGLAVIGMVLSGIIPYRTLPAWMYHAQIPPPDRIFDPGLPGLTWVDLVFPFFLFAMGTAIPFSMTSRLKKDPSLFRSILRIAERSAMLVVFAIFVRHIRPYVIYPDMWSDPFNYAVWVRALAGFVILFMLYLNYPALWPKHIRLSLRISSWIAAVLYLALLKFPDGSGFSPERMDIILMVLANMAFFGTLIWLVTRNDHHVRFLIMAVIAAMMLLAQQSEIMNAVRDSGGDFSGHLRFLTTAGNHWLMSVWNWTPASWLYQFSWLKYLLIVLPGTMAGDLILRSSGAVANRSSQTDSGRSFTLPAFTIPALSVFMILLTLVTMQARLSWPAYLLLTISGAVIVYVGSRLAADSSDFPASEFLKTAFMFLILGLFLEPLGGGIRKDPATLSYFFIGTALALYLLTTLSLVFDGSGKSGHFSTLLELTGRNPMIAYVASANLIWPILYVLHIYPGLKTELEPWPWLGFLLACAETYLLMHVTALFSRKKYYWKT